MIFSRRRVARIVFCLVMVTLRYAPVRAQIQNGDVTGVVEDASGAVLANARVTLTNSATGYQLSLQTNGQGIYFARELVTGFYKLKAEAPGFQSQVLHIQVNAGSVARVDVKMSIALQVETLEVEDTDFAVNLENTRLAHTLDSAMVEDLPLNGRNVYDLVQYAPGATNMHGVMYESGAHTVVDGVRENFNGFLINGVTNRDLNGDVINRPIVDTVQQVQVLMLNTSAELGDSAGALTLLTTKSGTNYWHGSGWEFLRNEALDANAFFANHFPNPADRKRTPFRLNQFGATLGGPILKNKLFFFAAYEGDRFLISSPGPVLAESTQFRDATEAAFPNSVASLLYNNFPVETPNYPAMTLRTYVKGGLYSGFGLAGFANYLCPINTDPQGAGTYAQKFARLFGVEQADITQLNQNCPGGSPFSHPFPGAFNRDDVFLVNALNPGKSQSDGDFFNGSEASLRLDYNYNQTNRFFAGANWSRATDDYTLTPTAPRGFSSPSLNITPNLQFTFIRTISSFLTNEFRTSYARVQNDVAVKDPGVPDIGLDDGSLGFGSYAGYPQVFRENIYSYSDLVSLSHGKHNLKIGADFKRNIEKGEYNLGRPSYSFFDPLFFAVDAPYAEGAGVDPGIVDHQTPELANNARNWRNVSFGAYVQDHWKITRSLTLDFGLRYDLFTRLVEFNHLGTTFLLGQGHNYVDNISTGAGQIKSASTPCSNPDATIAGVCGPGGFAHASSLGKGEHNDFGPRVGFAWDMFGDGKTALRASFSLAYQGILFSPQADSAWNLPYYSLNYALDYLVGGDNNVAYGPVTGGIPTFTGPAPAAQHAGAGAAGNISAWDPTNPELSRLTGIVLPQGLRDPYVENWFLGIQRQLHRSWMLETNYVGTAGRRLPRAESVNRVPGGMLPEGTCVTDNLGRKLCSQADNTSGTNGLPINPYGVLNPNFGKLRVWENVGSSIYHAMQVSIRKRLSHGLQLQTNYTYSHSIDVGSTWHNNSTSENGFAAGDGFSTDFTRPDLDRGNSVFDIRHRVVLEYSWKIPSPHTSAPLLGHLGRGWQINGIWSVQSGSHWTPFKGGSNSRSNLQALVPGACEAATFDPNNCVNIGSDYNLDGEANDRPNALVNHLNVSHDQWANGFNLAQNFFSTPCLGCVGNVGRNTFVGPGYWSADVSVFRIFKISDRVAGEFRVEAFNILNHTNFQFGGQFGPSQSNNLKNPLFGQAGGTSDPRNLQLAIKFKF